ncbi:hypothetical protein PINS_up014370 [Pythium insidiosum]|nr:hypothetical protein PINS_up014370 [Pythium insidiosum]
MDCMASNRRAESSSEENGAEARHQAASVATTSGAALGWSAPRTASPLALSTPVAARARVSVGATAREESNEGSDHHCKAWGQAPRCCCREAGCRREHQHGQPAIVQASHAAKNAKKVGSYRDPSDSMDDADGDDDGDYEQARDDDDDLDLPEVDNPQIFMPARERATLWAKKVLEQSDDPNALALVPKKERTKRKRSNSASSIDQWQRHASPRLTKGRRKNRRR